MDTQNQSIDMAETQSVQEVQSVQKDKNIFKYLFFIAITILLITTVGFYFYYINTNKEKTVISQNNIESISQTITPNKETQKSEDIDINQIYQQALSIAKSQPSLTLSTDNNFGTVWTTEDDKTIFIKNNNLSFEANQKQKVSDIDKFNPEPFNTLASSINKLLIDNNFSLNPKNTIKKEDYSFNSYESFDGVYKCVIYFPYQVSGSPFLEAPFNFTCFTKEQLESSYQEQISFIQDLNLKNSIIFDINTKNDETVLKLSDRSMMSVTVVSPNYYAYRSGNKWNYIFSGNDVSSCEDLIKRNVPKNHWVSCEYADNRVVNGNFSIKQTN